MVRSNSADDPTPEFSAARRAGFRMRILIVEDDSISSRALAKLLELEGCEVRQASDLPAAVRTASAWLPDVLLCDLDLGTDRDGVEVMRILRSAHPGLCAISISGHAPEIAARRSMQAGFARHLVKPITCGDALAAIRDATVQP